MRYYRAVNRRAFLITAAAGTVRVAQGQSGVQPITEDERQARIDKARRLMRENGISGLVMEGGSTSFYFTGQRSSPSGPLLFIPPRASPVWTDLGVLRGLGAAG